MKLRKRVAAVEEIVGHHFVDRDLIVSALTHPSAVEGKPVSASYERLEFLGDSILGAIVATVIFERYPGMDEGELSRLKIALVSGETLSHAAGELGIAPYILMGSSERGTSARGMHSALENVYEALVGALYLDAGYDETYDFIHRTLGPYMSQELVAKPLSPKSRLQEVTQRDFHCGPVYKLVGEEGPAHEPTFTSVVLVNGQRVGRGSGSTKKESEARAAEAALVELGYVPKDGAAAGGEGASASSGRGRSGGSRLETIRRWAEEDDSATGSDKVTEHWDGITWTSSAEEASAKAPDAADRADVTGVPEAVDVAEADRASEADETVPGPEGD